MNDLGEGAGVDWESDGGLTFYLDVGPKPGPCIWKVAAAFPPAAVAQLRKFLAEPYAGPDHNLHRTKVHGCPFCILGE